MACSVACVSHPLSLQEHCTMLAYSTSTIPALKVQISMHIKSTLGYPSVWRGQSQRGWPIAWFYLFVWLQRIHSGTWSTHALIFVATKCMKLERFNVNLIHKSSENWHWDVHKRSCCHCWWCVVLIVVLVLSTCTSMNLVDRHHRHCSVTTTTRVLESLL